MNQSSRRMTFGECARRALAVVVCLAVPVLFVVSFVVGVLGPSGGWFDGGWPLLISGPVVALNLHCSFVRSIVYRRRVGSLDGYRHVSGIPMIGWIGLILALLAGWGAPGTAAVGLVLCFLDTGGLFWFLVAVWRDPTFFAGRSAVERHRE